MSLVDDLIGLMHLKVEIYMNARACGNWELTQEETSKSCFHMLVQGECELHVLEVGRWLLEQGDVVIFRKELQHSMNSVISNNEPQEILPIADAQHLAGTSMLCGTINFNHRGSGLLINLLPKVVVIKKNENRYWLPPLTELIIKESIESAHLENPVLNRLCEVMIACTLRQLCDDPNQNTGLLAIYTHPQLSQAVLAMHEHPDADWNLSNLASKVWMSRTRFSQLFKQVAGITATQYLVWWRMQLAYGKLQEGHSVQDVSEQVGYQSEAAFSRAFKKEFNETVGMVRRKKVI
jgi:AraC-like DNA-binding protein